MSDPFWSFILIIIALGAAVLFLALRLQAASRGMKRLVSQLDRLKTLSGNGQIHVSETKQLREAAKILNDILAHLRTEKLRIEAGDETLMRTLAGWSHDLRTPLTAVRGYMALLQREPQTEKAEHYLDVISGRLAVLEDILEDLFAFSFALSAADALPLEPVPLAARTEEAAAAFYDGMTAKGIDLVLRIPEEPVYVRANERALTRVLYNLFSNAQKYAAEHAEAELHTDGTLTISNDARSLDPVRLNALLGQNLSVPLASEETGGLGLAVARMLCGKMGGTLTAEYINGSVRIAFSLPITKADDVPSASDGPQKCC